MAKYVAESKWIASIYPGKLWPITKYVGPHPNPRTARATVYKLNPVPRGGKPSLLEVTDAFQNVPNPMKAAESMKTDRIGSNMVFDSAPVACEEICENLIQEWAGAMVGLPAGARPGIMVIVGTVPMQAEMKQLVEQQTVFCEYLFQEGERLARVNDWKGITQTMRDSAVWLGHERIWSSPAKSSDVVQCPACRQVIPSDASVCHHCGTRVKAMSAELAAMNQVARPLDVPEFVPPGAEPETAVIAER